MCLDPVQWPVDVYETDVRQQKLYPDGVAGQMAALEAVGLAKGEDMELPGTFVDGKPKVKVRRYTMTDAAKPYLHANAGAAAHVLGPQVAGQGGALGRSGQGGRPRGVQRDLHLQAVERGRLGQEAAGQGSVPVLGRTVDGEHTQKEKLYVKLTPQGWEALGLND
jgi:hypothetical protein